MRSSSDRSGEVPPITIVAEDLSVRYGKGQGEWGLRGFSARFEAGITGLVGPNGAGKTTLLRTLAGCVKPAHGQVMIAGSSPVSFIAREGLGFLPETPPLPGYLTVEEFLGGICTSDSRGPTKDEAWAHFRLPDDLLVRSLGSLSQGQRKKVALVAALSSRPSVLLLDEPTNGLDPMALRDLRGTLLKERVRGTTILISSHHLDELQRIADALVFINKGRTLDSSPRQAILGADSSLEEIFNRYFGGDDGE